MERGGKGRRQGRREGRRQGRREPSREGKRGVQNATRQQKQSKARRTMVPARPAPDNDSTKTQVVSET